MRLLVNTTETLDGPYARTDDDISDIREFVKSELEDFSGRDLRVGFGDIMFGADDPDRVMGIAVDWNSEIRNSLMKQVNALMSTPEAMALDSDASNALYKAAKAADNRFSLWDEFGILHYNGSGWQTLEVVLDKRTMKQIKAAPEDWVVVSLTVC